MLRVVIKVESHKKEENRVSYFPYKSQIHFFDRWKDMISSKSFKEDLSVPNGQKVADTFDNFWPNRILTIRYKFNEKHFCKKKRSKSGKVMFRKWVQNENSKVRKLTKKMDKKIIFYVVSDTKHRFEKVITYTVKG